MSLCPAYEMRANHSVMKRVALIILSLLSLLVSGYWTLAQAEPWSPYGEGDAHCSRVCAQIVTPALRKMASDCLAICDTHPSRMRHFVVHRAAVPIAPMAAFSPYSTYHPPSWSHAPPVITGQM